MLKIEEVAVSDLTLDPDNARKHSERNMEAIVTSYREFGQQKPIVVTQDGIVVAGNGQLEAARQLGFKTIQVVRVPKEWTAEQIKAFAVADNRTAELAEWNGEVLLANLLDAQSHDLLALTGFSEIDLKILTQIYGDIPLPDEPYAPKDKEETEHAFVIHIPVSEAVKTRWDLIWNETNGTPDERVTEILDSLGAE
jgi:ParB-like chromosome segregation protein Spo0J